MIRLGPRFEEALVYAAHAHAGQRRKLGEGDPPGPPYIGHLLGVASLVIDDGGDEDEAIAALLHDAPEDQGGRPRLEDIRERFGERVAEIVDACTDTYENPKPSWRERKEAYISTLEKKDASLMRISLADKLHNARAVLADLRVDGERLWSRFNGGKEGTLWYYRTLTDLFCKKLKGGPMAEELERVVAEIEHLARA